jgi:hypothetical protein
MSMPRINNYLHASTILGNRVSRKIANNTYLIRADANTIQLKLHRSHIITWGLSLTYYNDCGWATRTTIDRLNSCLPLAFQLALCRGTVVYARGPLEGFAPVMPLVLPDSCDASPQFIEQNVENYIDRIITPAPLKRR